MWAFIEQSCFQKIMLHHYNYPSNCVMPAVSHTRLLSVCSVQAAASAIAPSTAHHVPYGRTRAYCSLRV